MNDAEALKKLISYAKQAIHGLESVDKSALAGLPQARINALKKVIKEIEHDTTGAERKTRSSVFSPAAIPVADTSRYQ